MEPNKGLNDGWEGSLRKAPNLYTSSWMFSDLMRFLIVSQYINSIDKKEPKVIDIGCSDCQLLEVQQTLGRSQHTKAIKYMGVEARKSARDNARKNVVARLSQSMQQKVKLVGLDITGEEFLIRLKSIQSDAVCILEVIEHIYPTQADALLQSVHKSLCENGLLLISTPVHMSPDEPMYYPDDHIHEYTIDELEAKLLSNGFVIVDKVGLHPNAVKLKKLMADQYPDAAALQKRLIRLSKQGPIVNTVMAFDMIEACEDAIFICRRKE